MNEEQKPFEFAELPQPGNGPAQEPVKRKRGRRRGTTAKRTMRVGKAPDPAALQAELTEIKKRNAIPPSKAIDRRDMVLRVIMAMHALDQADARYVASLFA